MGIAIAFLPTSSASTYNCYLQSSCPDGPTGSANPNGWSYYPLTAAVDSVQEFGDATGEGCWAGDGGYGTTGSTLEQCQQECIDQASCIAIVFLPTSSASTYNCYLQSSCPDGPTGSANPNGWSYYPLTADMAETSTENAESNEGADEDESSTENEDLRRRHLSGVSRMMQRLLKQ